MRGPRSDLTVWNNTSTARRIGHKPEQTAKDRATSKSTLLVDIFHVLKRSNEFDRVEIYFTLIELASEMFVCLSNVLPREKSFFEFQLVFKEGISTWQSTLLQ